MSPKIWVFTICWNEAQLISYWLRHYSTFAEKLVVWDEHSDDGTREFVKITPKAELRDWPNKGLDDDRFLEAINNWYREARGKADWVMWADVDEILWHPEPLRMLAECKADVVQATGYGMISREPCRSTPGQIYDTYRTGVRQKNYDKAIIWRPGIELQQTHGRHVYKRAEGGFEWPKSKQRVNYISAEHNDWKLLHYHYFGVDYTAHRNQRNYDRANNKRFAWNYSAEHNANPQQVGSVAWVKAALEGNQLMEVIPAPVITPRKIQLGAGGLNIPGFENYDREVDLRKPLPFPDGSCSHIVMSHCLEHVTFQEAWNCIAECLRILGPGGVVRIAIPDLAKMNRDMTPAYQEAVKRGGHSDGSKSGALRACVFCHGHESVWTAQLLETVMQAIGFKTRRCDYGKSKDSLLCNVDLHGRTVGEDIAQVESSIVEGLK